MAEHTKTKIRARAFALWQAHGYKEGQDMDFWLLAEREVLNAAAPSTATSAPEATPKAAVKPKPAAK